MNRFVSFAALALGAGAFLALRRQSRRHGYSMQPHAAPEQTWESEGGSLSSTGAQMGPDPLSAETRSGVREYDALAPFGESPTQDPVSSLR